MNGRDLMLGLMLDMAPHSSCTLRMLVLPRAVTPPTPSPLRSGRASRKFQCFSRIDGFPRAKFVHPLGLPLKSSF
jgi:hypothetical protein